MDTLEWLGHKIESEVFDIRTLKILSKMFGKRIFKSVDWPISTGKEANVFRATISDKKYLAIKIYKRETSNFVKKRMYFEGDPRFERSKYTIKNSALLFARKEYKNLNIAQKANVHSPMPVYLNKHIVVMGFLGRDGLPYPLLKDVKHSITKKAMYGLIQDIKKLYNNNLVHSDLSEYNTLFDVKNDQIYIIDYSQGVVKGHPRYTEFLKRDIKNIADFIKKSRYNIDENGIYDYIESNSGMPNIIKR